MSLHKPALRGQELNLEQVNSTLSYVKDLKKFFEDIIKARDIAEPKFVLGADYSSGSRS